MRNKLLWTVWFVYWCFRLVYDLNWLVNRLFIHFNHFFFSSFIKSFENLFLVLLIAFNWNLLFKLRVILKNISQELFSKSKTLHTAFYILFRVNDINKLTLFIINYIMIANNSWIFSTALKLKANNPLVIF